MWGLGRARGLANRIVYGDEGAVPERNSVLLSAEVVVESGRDIDPYSFAKETKIFTNTLN